MSGTIKSFNPRHLMQPQRGNDCKIIAIGSVLNWLYNSKQITTKPLPARFRPKDKGQKKPKTGGLFSLRQVAKTKAKDSVTEAISDPQILVEVAQYHSEIAADYVHCETEAHYINVLKQAIDRQLTPIVFFDVGQERPSKFKGSHEHAAIVIAYEETRAGTVFTLAQWSKKTTGVDGRALFESTHQLRQERKAENYYKYPDRKDEEGRGWIPESQIREPELTYLRAPDRFYKADLKEHYLERVVPEISAEDNHGGLRGKILLITSQKQGHLIKALKSESLKTEPTPRIKKPYQNPYPWSWSKSLLWLFGLASLYTIAHSTTVLILKVTLLGLSTSTASWVLMLGLVALMILIMLAADQYTKKCPLPKLISTKPDSVAKDAFRVQVSSPSALLGPTPPSDQHVKTHELQLT